MYCIPLLIIAYFIFQILYIPYPALSVDEFWFGHHIYQYLHHLPYRDFPPYKTILGYYVLSIPLLFFHDAMQALFAIKFEIAMINTIALSVISFLAARFFRTQAIFLTLLILISSQFFLLYSVDLRVDMLTAWLGLFSILFILSNRFILAGVLLSCSFLVSQKAIWFFMATNMALLIQGLWFQRNRKSFFSLIQFNLAMVLPIILYIAVWAYVSHLSTVLHSLFYEAYTQSQIHWYTSIYYISWKKILSNGPLLILLWPLTWITLWTAPLTPQRVLIAIYSAIMMYFIMSYQQAFPYNIVLSFPVFFILYSDFFSWLFTPSSIKINPRALFWFLSFCTLFIVSMTILFGLPVSYFFAAGIPICLGLRMVLKEKCFIFCVGILIFFTGIFYPLLRSSILAYTIDGKYQQHMVRLASALIDSHESYLAGTPLIYNKDQTIRGLKNLIGPAIAYLYIPDPHLLPILITSLDMTPRTQTEILQDLKNHPVKLYINNYRIESLPLPIRRYLNLHYKHFWGSIYVYGPDMKKMQQKKIVLNPDDKKDAWYNMLRAIVL